MQIDTAMANKMVDRAVAECAEEHFAGDARRMRQAVLHGHCEHCRCITDHLVRQIGEYFGQVDNTIKAVYRYETLDLSSASQSEGMDLLRDYNDINLIVWVNRKSAALAALAKMWESALRENLRQLGCVLTSPACLTLNVTMVDDRDIDERRGLGLLVNNPSLRSNSRLETIASGKKGSP